MPLIVVGGQASKIGKTSAVVAILSRFRNLPWAAVKIAPHLHQPEKCELTGSGSGWRLWKQTAPDNDSDTARFLSAGAKIALLLQANDPSQPMAAAALQRELEGHSHVVIESGHIVDFIRPDLFLMLVSASREDMKPWFERRVVQADMLLVEGEIERLPIELQQLIRDKPTFELRLPVRKHDPWMEAVAERIGAKSAMR